MGSWLGDAAMEVGGGNLEGDLSGGTKQMDLPTRHCGGIRFGELSGGPAGQTSCRADRVGGPGEGLFEGPCKGIRLSGE